MSQSPSMKRKQACRDTKSLPKRRIKSCHTCRRLKTRCEVEHGAVLCHRCDLLKLECSLDISDVQPGNAEHFPFSEGHISLHGTQAINLEQRVLALESSFAHVRASLAEVLGRNQNIASQEVARQSDTGISKFQAEDSSGWSSHGRVPLVADRNSRTAPASLIRDMQTHMFGEERGLLENDVSQDIVAKGIISHELATSLLIGFAKLSRRWLFMRSDLASLQQAPSLLRASCVLAGLQIDSSLHGTQVHHNLYEHVSGLLSKAMLASRLSLEAIQSMFIFSMWNLVPNSDTEHLDPWLLSGIAGMQGMLAINFEQLLKPRTDGLVDSRSRETLRSWNLICLCHLQFSVGTGRPPVLSRQYLKQCKNILSLPSYDQRDKLVAAGVDLYDSLCNIVNSETVQTDSLVWKEIDEWKKSCGPFFELDSTKPLRFAYSCSYLILTRRTLKFVSEQPAKPHSEISSNTDLDFKLYIRLAIEHAHRILHLFLAMSDLTAFVRPAYENLLCSFAMITLSEFVIYLDDIDQSLALMERTSQHIQLGGKAEPVSNLALSIMRKQVSDNSGDVGGSLGVSHANTFAPGRMADSSSTNSVSLPADFENVNWVPGDTSFPYFPSLEEMFLPS